jgi:dGTPase
VLYSSAFRRLGGVTQVASAAEGYVFHNRLTHTIEVAQVARRLAENLLAEQPRVASDLGIDPDVAETAALCHDLGHPPFGHVIEHELDHLVLNAGDLDGFEGNAQSFRIVTKLAIRNSQFSGLNLTRATLAAVLKYPWFRATRGKHHHKWGAYRSERREFAWARQREDRDVRSAEADVMDRADDIAYSVHDVEDFYRAGLIPLHLLASQSGETDRFVSGVLNRRDRHHLTLTDKQIRRALERVFDLFPLTGTYDGRSTNRAYLRSFTSRLIANYLTAIRLQSDAHATKRHTTMPKSLAIEVDVLKQLVWHYVILNPSLTTQQFGHRKVIRELFAFLLEAARMETELLPASAQDEVMKINRLRTARSRRIGRIRLTADTIASMSEQSVLLLYKRISGVSPGSIMDFITR